MTKLLGEIPEWCLIFGDVEKIPSTTISLSITLFAWPM